MTAEFPYRPEPAPGGHTVYRPVAKVVFHGPNGRSVTQLLYVDSGADHTLLPYRLGKYLGLDQFGSEVQEIHGMNGSVGVIYACIDTELASLRFPVKVAWAQLEEVPPLLGRTDVFDHFDITFQQSRHLVLFNPAHKNKS
jgi:hypothetical protein